MDLLTCKLQEVFDKEGLVDCKLSFLEVGFSCYDHNAKEVILDMVALKKQYNEFITEGVMSCSFDDYSTIVLLHEIGHYKDKDLIKSKGDKRELMIQMGNCDILEEYAPVLDKYMEVELKTEQKAWKYVFDKQLKGLNDEVYKIANHCLQLYKDNRLVMEKMFCQA